MLAEVPWCESCSRFLNPNTLLVDGNCPDCGRHVADPQEAEAQAAMKTPWHFKLLVAATVIYLTWRIIQMLSWAVT